MLYVFEACPMLFALCILGYYHPGKWLPRSTFAGMDAKRGNRDIEAK
jgi:hypothetical protein